MLDFWTLTQRNATDVSVTDKRNGRTQQFIESKSYFDFANFLNVFFYLIKATRETFGLQQRFHFVEGIECLNYFLLGRSFMEIAKMLQYDVSLFVGPVHPESAL